MKLFFQADSFRTVSFDLDGVLVQRPITIASWYDFVVETVIDYARLDREEAVRFLASHGIDGNGKQSQGSLTLAMIELGFSREAWNKFKTDSFDYGKYFLPNPDLVESVQRLKSISDVIVVSNNTHGAVRRSLDATGFPKDTFSYIAAYEPNTGHTSEVDKYAPYLSASGRSFKDVVALGDKFDNDIAPVLNQGGSGILVEDYSETVGICDMLCRKLRGEASSGGIYKREDAPF